MAESSTVRSGGHARRCASDARATGFFFGAPRRILAPRLLFIAAVVALCAIGIVAVYSTSAAEALNDADISDPAYYVKHQAFMLALGIIVCIVATAVPYTVWAKPPFVVALWLASIVLVGLTATDLAATSLGADRSVTTSAGTVQPTEVAKFLVVVVFAAIVSMYRSGNLSLRGFLIASAAAIVPPVVLIAIQPDLGTTIFVFVGILAVLVLSGCSLKPIAGFCVVLAVFVGIILIVQPYHLERIQVAIDPWVDPDGSGYQSIQARWALASGGLIGRGLGMSQQKYQYLPEAHTDFIFAVIGEEGGLLATLSIVVLFIVFVWAGILISRRASDVHGCLLAGGVTVMIGFQAWTNMCCVTGPIPVTGKTLPFISYGGSSLIATLAAVGLVLSVSMRSKVGAANERRRDDLRVMQGGCGAGRFTGRAVPFPGSRRDGERSASMGSSASGASAREARSARRPSESRARESARAGGARYGSSPQLGSRSERSLPTRSDAGVGESSDSVYRTGAKRVRANRSPHVPTREGGASDGHDASSARRTSSTKPTWPSGTTRR